MIKGHGDDLYKYVGIKANFSSNVYGATDNSKLLAHLQKELPRLACSYPEPEPFALQEQIAKYHGVKPEEVLVTNGATEAIYLIAHLTAGKRTHIIQPTFSEYADACRLHKHQFVGLDKEEVETLWFCNPNNPTGQLWDEDELMQGFHQDALFVIDRSYDYFARKPLTPICEMLRKNRKQVFIHSFTKSLKIPGIRLGYIIGTGEVIQQIRALRQPWSVNALAIEAGRFFLANQPYEAIDKVELFTECDRLIAALNRIEGVRAYPTDTHFFLLEMPFKASEIKERLAEDYGLLVRDASNFEGLSERHLRIATQTAKENTLLINALRQIISRPNR